nr:MAG TPA: hypothetical protein [Caudoviricetes sp.]
MSIYIHFTVVIGRQNSSPRLYCLLPMMYYFTSEQYIKKSSHILGDVCESLLTVSIFIHTKHVLMLNMLLELLRVEPLCEWS